MGGKILMFLPTLYLAFKQNCILRHACTIDGLQVEGEKETESDNWQHNKSKGQDLTSLTSTESLISHKSLFKNKKIN